MEKGYTVEVQVDVLASSAAEAWALVEAKLGWGSRVTAVFDEMGERCDEVNERGGV